MNKKFLMYIPHGIDDNKFFPIDESNQDEINAMNNLKNALFKGIEPKFVILYNNRNIRRKQVGNVILAYNEFLKLVPSEHRKECFLILHTAPVDPNGTDLPAVATELAPNANIVFSPGKIDYKELNRMYNIADITINMANAEGFGLSTAESIMAGTIIMATVTGGLQDQMRFLDENQKPIKFSKDWGSNSDGRVKDTNGEWCFPLFPRTRSISGSPKTPYIFDDFSDFNDAAVLLKKVYDIDRSERKRRGIVGRNWMLSESSGMSSQEMGKRFIDGIDFTLENWEKRDRYSLHKI